MNDDWLEPAKRAARNLVEVIDGLSEEAVAILLEARGITQAEWEESLLPIRELDRILNKQ